MTYRYPTVKVNGRTRLRHRVAMEKKLGRPLRSDEHVHHKNEDTFDDSPENLEVLSPTEHMRHHKQKHPYVKHCRVCGAEFTPAPTKRARQEACSPKCGYTLGVMKRRGEA